MIRIESFPPLIGNNPKLLILGSMPGEASLQAHQYYAHPRNQFWPIMSQILGIKLELEYVERIKTFQNHPIALWDVLQSCIRPGSLDSAITQEHPTKIAELLEKYTSIETIAFNGQTAAKLFKRHIKLPRDLTLLTLPSTSPAHAGLGFEAKLKIWQDALIPLLQ